MKNKISCCALFLLTIFCVATYAGSYTLKNPESGQNLMCPGGQHVIGVHEICLRTGCVVDELHCN